MSYHGGSPDYRPPRRARSPSYEAPRGRRRSPSYEAPRGRRRSPSYSAPRGRQRSPSYEAPGRGRRSPRGRSPSGEASKARLFVRLHHTCTTRSPHLFHTCTTLAPHMPHTYSTFAPQLHHTCTTPAPHLQGCLPGAGPRSVASQRSPSPHPGQVMATLAGLITQDTRRYGQYLENSGTIVDKLKSIYCSPNEN